MGRAEGRVYFTLDGHDYAWPYRTDLVNRDGVNVHFWSCYAGNQKTVARAAQVMCRYLDVVTVTWEDGDPPGFYPRPIDRGLTP
jgi:hypothetical protein